MEPIGDFEYSKKDLIGHGAFAVVFRGRHKKKPDFTVAIKCITKKNLAKSQNLLSKEIKILRELSDLHHENVVALLDCKETTHHVYLVMEYCNGGDLADYLQAKGTLSEDTIALFLRQIAAAMKALNAKGIVHRDLKPQNILLCHRGKPNASPQEIRLKIADFGFARFLQDGVMAATLCGSPMYMAPEVIMSLQYGAKADLWSVGTIVYQCLTGKAPFQAQTPQQLKQFYERNSNLAPNIPSGTSQELRSLLMCLLKRNAKDRIDFDEFFKHPFLNVGSPKSSSPVPVPRSRSRNSLAESPPLKAINSSPLSGNIPMSPPHPALQRVREQQAQHEPMDQGPSPQEPHGFFKLHKENTPPRCASPTEDYVMVPENVPADPLVGSASRKHPSSVDLNAIFSDNSPDSPKPPPRAMAASPQYGGHRTPPEGQYSPQQTSPSRPSTLPVIGAPPTSSQPIPVPSQVKAYQQMQRSLSSPGSACNNLAGMSRQHGATVPANLNQQGRSTSPVNERGINIPPRSRKGSTSSIPDVGSMSPPSVQFTVGTPPNAGAWKRTNSFGTSPIARAGTTPPSASGSPLRKSGTSPVIKTPPYNNGPSSLPTIVGSPTKMGTAFQFPDSNADSPVDAPIQVPFGSSRPHTCPDDMASEGHVEALSVVPLKNSATEPQQLFRRSNSGTKLSEHLLRAAFGGSTTPPGLPGNKQQGAVVPYSGSNMSLGRESSNSDLQRRNSSVDMETPSYCPSPSNMEGPISFTAPELAEEVLMEKEHNETVNKLNFVLALVECIIELAHSRSSPLSESVDQRQGNNAFRLDHIAFVSESQRLMEQLVLYVRALQLLSSSIELAREETKSGRLQPSNAVKLILREMNNYYHQCLNLCRQLHCKGVGHHPDVNPHHAATTADKLIYSYAIEMCQTAALDELFDNPQDCFRRYRSAQILLHSLAQQAQNAKDKELLRKYKENVEKRLMNLASQGMVNAYTATTS